MTEQDRNTVAGDEEAHVVHPQKIYLKDASFESPHSPEIFTQGWKPNLEVEIDSHAHRVADDTYDVVMKITATASLDGTTAFVAEVQQAGIFLLRGFEPEKLQQLQNVFCLRTLYPYASAAIADLVTRGGFPSLMLVPMNFAAIYEQRLEQKRSEASETKAAQH
jgi:preprotein translocase subunit SecB